MFLVIVALNPYDQMRRGSSPRGSSWEPIEITSAVYSRFDSQDPFLCIRSTRTNKLCVHVPQQKADLRCFETDIRSSSIQNKRI